MCNVMSYTMCYVCRILRSSDAYPERVYRTNYRSHTMYAIAIFHTYTYTTYIPTYGISDGAPINQRHAGLQW